MKGRVYLRKPSKKDSAEFLARVGASRSLHRPWVTPPTTETDFRAYLLRTKRPENDSAFVCRVKDDAIVGVINASQIFRGNFSSAYLGYYAFVPFSGEGYMSEGLRLFLSRAFGALRLHRVEANIQPGNSASIALVRKCGFRREGYSPRYLKIGGKWRDHERWALLKEDYTA